MHVLHVTDGEIECKIRAPGIQLAPAFVQIVPHEVDAKLIPFALAHPDAAVACTVVGEDVRGRSGRVVVAHHT
ncbi:hypothetical protein ABQY58_000865 [Xanthomonas hortorum pv. hederae]|uniref:hypothetical protein n=1 Tax=Xanthomonas hortorum TaxID=56454 RepID=UPI0035A9977B